MSPAVNLVEEYWVNKGIPDALVSLDEMYKTGASMPAAVVAVVIAALDHRGQDVTTRLSPFVEVLVTAAKAASSGSGALSPDSLAQGALLLARSLHSLAEDMPKVMICVKHSWLIQH